MNHTHFLMERGLSILVEYNNIMKVKLGFTECIMLRTMAIPIILTKIIQLKEWGSRDGMDHAKNCGNKILLAVYTIEDTSTIMCNPLPGYQSR